MLLLSPLISFARIIISIPFYLRFGFRKYKDAMRFKYQYGFHGRDMYSRNSLARAYVKAWFWNIAMITNTLRSRRCNYLLSKNIHAYDKYIEKNCINK